MRELYRIRKRIEFGGNKPDFPRAVIALTGRRIDAPDTDPPRFLLANVPIVRKRLSGLFSAEHAVALVCSAACGADLIALEEAERLGIRRRIVLPFQPERFRETSVSDRPGDWGSAFDRLISSAEAVGDLVVLSNHEVDDASYRSAGRTIIREAETLARAIPNDPMPRLVVAIVWEGGIMAEADISEGIRSLAKEAGFEERFLLTS